MEAGSKGGIAILIYFKLRRGEAGGRMHNLATKLCALAALVATALFAAPSGAGIGLSSDGWASRGGAAFEIAAAPKLPGPRPTLPPPAPVGEAPRPPAEVVPTDALPEPIVDPIEPVNRGIFFINDIIDTLILRPVAVVYGFILPEVAKKSVRNFFANLSSPIILGNDLLQLTFGDAAVTTGRFVVNSTLGVLGLFEVAEDFGLKRHYADFGQTLFSYGMGQGFYLVLPIFGPSTLRDGVGLAADGFMTPLTYLVDFPVRLAISGAEGVSRREALIEALDDLRETSLDYYAAVRGAYYQDRAVDLRKGREDISGVIDTLFEDID